MRKLILLKSFARAIIRSCALRVGDAGCVCPRVACCWVEAGPTLAMAAHARLYVVGMRVRLLTVCVVQAPLDYQGSRFWWAPLPFPFASLRGFPFRGGLVGKPLRGGSAPPSNGGDERTPPPSGVIPARYWSHLLLYTPAPLAFDSIGAQGGTSHPFKI